MLRQLTTTLLLLSAVFTISSCSRTRTYHLSETRFGRTPADVEVKLFVTRVEEPHIDIARIESFAWSNPSAEKKRAQLEDLVRRARRLGGEAVVEIKEYQNIVQGMIEDEVTPFPSPTQSTTERSFYRGVVIRYVSSEDEAYQWSKEVYGEVEDPLNGRTFGRGIGADTDSTQGTEILISADL